MNTYQIIDALGMIDDKFILQAKGEKMNTNTMKRKIGVKKTILLIAAVVAVLSLCGFAAYELGLFDLWLQTPSADPTETVRSAIEGQLDKEYTLNARVESVAVDEAETKEVLNRYIGSDLAKERGWTDDYLKKHFVVVSVRYYVEYDHTKTFLEDGLIEQYFYLTQDESGEWTIIDNTTNMATS